MSRALLTLPQAQKAIGMKGPQGRKLKRLILARERSLRREIMIRLPGRRRENPRVSLSALRRYLPELFPSEVDTLQRDVGKFLRGIDDRMREIACEEIEDQVEPRLQELWTRDETVAKTVKALAKKVEVVAARSR